MFGVQFQDLDYKTKTWHFLSAAGNYLEVEFIETYLHVNWCFSDRASWIDYILITNLMHWLLFIHKMLYSSTCFEPQVLIFRRRHLYTCSIMVLSLCTRVRGGLSVQSLSSHSSFVPTGHHEQWQYNMLHVYNCILLKMSTWGSKHVEEYNILWINNNQCIKLVINV